MVGFGPGILPGLHPLTFDSSDLRWAKRALELARLADYRTSPNPMVGAVVVDSSGEVIGEGYHRAKGSPHAEEDAIRAAGPAARGGTLYVNLEPCLHAHRTPSCAELVIAAGVRRVVVSMLDPDDRMRGRGLQHIEAAGVATALGAEADAAARLNEFYVRHRTTGRPFVTAKFAMSLDGKIATAAGESRWITGPVARAYSHRLRHEHDAILVGVGTVLADDPELTVREGVENPRQPLRIVLDSSLRTPVTARVLGDRSVIASTKGGAIAGAEVLKLPAGADGRVAVGTLLDELGRRGIMSLLVEGGAATNASFFGAGMVDKVLAFVAPKLIGGHKAPGPIGGDGIARLSDAVNLRDTEIVSFGEDYMISGYIDVHRDR